MKFEDIQCGDLVAVNNLSNGQVYTVAEKVAPFRVGLEYPVQGEMGSGGFIDISVLRKPTKKQMSHYEKSLFKPLTAGSH
jgi:hypothetical protein